MAWTWSATRRESFAIAVLASAGQQTLATHLFNLGKGDATRGAFVIFAAFLTIAGVAVPHVAPVTLTTFLFLSGAALALFAAFNPWDGTASPFADASLTERPTAPSMPPSPAPLRHALFTELLTAAPTHPAIDRAAWARLTAHMSHELRTPLNAVLGFSELMSNEVFGPMGSSCYSAYARDIHASGRMLLKSAEDALAITALLTAPERSGAPATANAARAIEEAIAFHAQDFTARSIAITTHFGCDADIIADAQTVRQMFINLLADAAAHAGEGASLSLTSAIADGHVAVTLALSGPSALPVGGDRFALLLARTLAELSGAHLIDAAPVRDGAWQMTVLFTAAVQRDFFALRH